MGIYKALAPCGSLNHAIRYIYYLTGILGIGRIPVKQNKAIVKTYLAIGNSPTTALDCSTWPKFDRYRTEEL